MSAKLLIRRDGRYQELMDQLAAIPALQSHVTAIMQAAQAIAVPFIVVPCSLEEAGKSLARLVPNSTSAIMNFESDVEQDMIDCASAIRLELLRQGSPTLSVGDRVIPLAAEQIIALNLISVDEGMVRGLVLARRALDAFVKGYPELCDYISINATGLVVVSDKVHKFLDDKFCTYARAGQLRAWEDLQGVVNALERIRNEHGIILDQIARNISHGPDDGYVLDPVILSLTDQRRQPVRVTVNN